MKKAVLCVSLVFAFGNAAAMADEMTSAPAYYISLPTPTLQWSGLYFGINGGYGWSNSSVSLAPNDPAALLGTSGGGGTGIHGQAIPSTNFTIDGALAGGQIGFNYQITPLWLVGLEADYQWSDFKGSATTSAFRLGSVGTTNMLFDETVKSFGTVRARMGVIPAAPLLLYGTAGLAYGQVSDDLTVANPLASGTGSLSAGGFSYLCSAGGPACFAGSSSQTLWGWTAGAGAEYALTSNLILRGEASYVNLGVPSGTALAQRTVAGTSAASFTAGFSSVSFVFARGGLSFKF